MKVTLFYKIGDERGVYPEPILYAYTDKKDIASIFYETRRHDIFIKKERDYHKNDFYNLCIRRPNNILIKSTLITRETDIYHSRKFISFAMTKLEEDTVFFKSELVYEKIQKLLSNKMILVNDECIKALDTLGYWEFYKYYNYMSDFFLDYHVNQFELFLYFFGDTIIKP